MTERHLYQGLGEVPPARRAIALGTFDGVHAGHRAVIQAAVTAARRLDAIACVATFTPRPVTVLRPDMYPATLAGVTQRVRYLMDAGADEVVLFRFTRAVAELSAEAFVQEMLIERLGAVSVTVGEDFRFGHDRSGDVALLRALCEPYGTEVQAIRLVDSGGEKISSSRIRNLIADGAVDAASELLLRLPSLEGAVVHGDQRGRDLGYPTANLSLVPGQQLPKEGVYAGWGVLPPGERRYPAAISVGRNPHFADVRDLRVEAHLIDYDGQEIYGVPIRLEFAVRLRAQEVYDDVPALVAQISRDVADTRRLLNAQ